MHCPYYEVESFTEVQYVAMAAQNPELVAFSITDLFDALLFSVPMNVGKVTNIVELIEGTLERYGDTGCVFDYETMGLADGAALKIKENLLKHAVNPKEAFSRIMGDINKALANISKRITEKLESIDSPVIDEVGSIYRYHGLEKGQVILQILSYKEIMNLSGRQT